MLEKVIQNAGRIQIWHHMSVLNKDIGPKESICFLMDSIFITVNTSDEEFQSEK